MNVYVDSSVIVRLILEERAAIERWGDWDIAVTSELAGIEVLRVRIVFA